MRTKERRIRSEQGAVFVQVGISIFVLMAFNVFVLDYGMMWIGRRQIQNAADAGALSGALARGFDDFGNPPAAAGQAALSAQRVAAANLVWRQAAVPRVQFTCPAGVNGKCVRVDVYRNSQFGSTSLPTLFGPILGVTSQGVRATATAIAVNGNATTCMKPWALADEWHEYGSSGHRHSSDVFSRYLTPGPGMVTNPDSYSPPSSSAANSINVSGHFGELVPFDVGQPFTSPITAGFVLPTDLPGGRTFEQDMVSCNGQPIVLGQRLSIDLGVTPAVAEASLTSAFDLDRDANYNYGDSYVINTCAPQCASSSPRLFAVALYDPDDFQRRRAQSDWSGCPNGTPCVIVRNITGFFIHRLSGVNGRHGHWLKYPGMTAAGAPNFTDDASWLVTTHLIR